MADGSVMPAMSVAQVLQGYANRGLFRDFHADEAKGEFGFIWMNHTPMRVQWKPAARTLTFRDLLPKAPPRGEMDRDIRAFLKSRTAADLPDHRRVDPQDFELVCSNRSSADLHRLAPDRW